ncbi:hypothetical protein TWF730_001938 [Orbilia blumenaviensis]|uniref:Zn(2)-C6 fungal-type domain-containing protein n=1 Tax=Orbilia blumenaviensis TaxID=1796055 RepID=A0AAV9UGU8_9PEZI
MSLKRSASVADGNSQSLMDEHAPNPQVVPTIHSGNSSAVGTVKSEDFGRTVRKRLQNTTRTGQACDRCKIRKIRCDGLAGGCSPCRQNTTECRTTDRISHRAVPRGYIEQLEKKCADYEARMKDMEALLQAGGLASPGGKSHDGSSTSSSNVGWNPSDKDHWRSSESGTIKLEQQTLPYSMDYSGHHEPNSHTPRTGRSPIREENDVHGRPAFLVRKSGAQAHVGVYSGNSCMTSTRASALSVLGISIDLADLQGVPEPARSLNYISVDGHMDFKDMNPLDDSLQSFLMSTSGHAPASVLRLSLPSKEEALMLIEWNWVATQPYLPIVHKPTFMAEFHRMYDIPDYKTSPASLVITHMICAMSMYFMAKREIKIDGQSQQPDLIRAYRHYHFSLSFLNLLVAGGTLEDCQALVYLLAFTRGFTRPGPSYILSKVTTATIFELRLNRSLKKQHLRSGAPLNVLEDEMRKRVFWTGVSIDVGISAKLNRPIGVFPSDYDVEYPARIEDEYITEAGFTQEPLPINAEGRCSFDVVFGLIKCAEFTIEIHTKLYSAQKPHSSAYQPFVDYMEAQMTGWKDNLPPHLKYDPGNPDVVGRMQAGNLMLWYNELRILLRHPSLNLSTSPSFNSDNLTICVESSRTILEMTDLLRRENNLDTAWYATSVPLLACMTILFAIWEKRETVTQAEIARVKADMDLSVCVMKDFGRINAIGSNSKLGDIIVSLTDATMKMLRERHGNRLAMNGTNSTSNSHNAPAAKRRASLTPKTFAPPPVTAHEVQQPPIPPMSHLNKHYTYQPSQAEQQQISPGGQGALYVDTSVNPIAQMSHVSLHPVTYADNSAIHSAASALTAAAHQHHPQQPQQQATQAQHQPPYFIPHTTAPADTSPYWYGAPESWKEYLTQMTSLAGDSQGFPAMALMSLGQPGRGDVDGTWGFMNVYDFDNGGN